LCCSCRRTVGSPEQNGHRSMNCCLKLAGVARVGTCGFGMAQATYARAFSCIEVQHTFYQPPSIKTLATWRTKMPADFEFTVKAWQLITHDAKSPTYRRLKRTLSENEKQECGYFRPTAVVNEAWETTLASAKALKARTIVFQCPASFKQTDKNIASMDQFFSSIDRQDLDLCWEPRGEWNPTVVRSICARLRLCHVVDPFLNKTETRGKYYFRLHGKTGWRYQYETDELEELAAWCISRGDGYVFFNNYKMSEDALKFCQVLNRREG